MYYYLILILVIREVHCNDLEVGKIEIINFIILLKIKVLKKLSPDSSWNDKRRGSNFIRH